MALPSLSEHFYTNKGNVATLRAEESVAAKGAKPAAGKKVKLL